jgi:hypothetical protein
MNDHGLSFTAKTIVSEWGVKPHIRIRELVAERWRLHSLYVLCDRIHWRVEALKSYMETGKPELPPVVGKNLAQQLHVAEGFINNGKPFPKPERSQVQNEPLTLALRRSAREKRMIAGIWAK